jgi:hypothetical protein
LLCEDEIALWPVVAKEALSEAHARSCENAEQALHAVATGTRVAVAAKRYRLCRKRLRNMLIRAIEIADDGRPYGYRVCVPWGVYRQRPSDAEEVPPTPLEARPHALRQLLEAHPTLRRRIEDYAHPLPPGRPPRSFERLFGHFVAELKKQGLGAAYPLNQRDEGRRALLRYLRKQRTTATVRNLVAGDTAPTGVTRLSDIFAHRLYDRFELDAHRIDIEAKVGLRMPNGGEVRRAVTCLWFIAVIEVASRAIMAWLLCVGRAYGSLDLALCLSRVLEPWVPRTFSIPGLAYPPGAGMPSGLPHGFAGRRGVLIALDNAKAHHAYAIENSFCRAHDGILNYGRAHEPRLRPIVEQLFARLERGAFRALPGGFEPATRLADDKLRISNFSPEDHPLQIHLLEELLEVIVAGYNATPHPALGTMTPLQYLETHGAGNDWFFDAADNASSAAEMSSIFVPVTIRGSRKNGDLPHVNYAYVRYRNADLDHGWELIGTKVFAKIYRHDLRTLTLYRSATEPMGVLTAVAPWCETAHDETTRKLIFQWAKQGRLKLHGVDCAIAAYVACLRELAPTSLPAVDQLVRLQQQHRAALPTTPRPTAPSTEGLLPRGGWVSLDHKKDSR